ncbi:Probable peptidyl-prolyl cis-trans isomerase [Geodia barretti]|uniref:peptidylprolyl isomerase n=3 Tax=Geodia barretti TaxID=519541 RepID=A0AA35WQI6_GEOBA|nr:Probable peptidyl-prolyl cis-trans isomerase [Geodia barretti]
MARGEAIRVSEANLTRRVSAANLTRRVTGAVGARRAALAGAAALLLVACGGLDDGLYARIVTDEGRILVRLHEERAPLPVAAFVGLAEGVLGPDRFYDGSIVEIASEQLVMSGGVRGRGLGRPDWEIPDEFHPELRHDRPGVVSLLTEGPHTGSSRFVITRRAAPELDEVYPVFGEVVDGQEVLDTLRRGQTLQRVRIVRVGPAARAYRVDGPGFAELRSQVAQELLRQVLQRHERDARRVPPPLAGCRRHRVRAAVRGPQPGRRADAGLRGQGAAALHGSLVDGTQFGTSGIEPMEFTIGAVVKGLEEMLLAMRRGGRRTVLIPPDLGYGAMGVPGTVPPRAFLIFDVELVGFSN